MTAIEDHDPYDAIDQQAKAMAEAEQLKAYKVADLKWLMSQKRGRRVVRRLLEDAGVYRLSYVPGAQDGDRATAFAEGRRNLGLELTTVLLEHCSNDYARMIQEKAENDGN